MHHGDLAFVPALDFQLTFAEFGSAILGRITRGLPTMLLCDLGDGHHRVWLCLNPPGEPDAFSDPTFVQLLRDRFDEMRAARIYAAHHRVGHTTAQMFERMHAHVHNGHVAYEHAVPYHDPTPYKP